MLYVSLQMKFPILDSISAERVFMLAMFKPFVIPRSNSFVVPQATRVAHMTVVQYSGGICRGGLEKAKPLHCRQKHLCPSCLPVLDSLQ